MSTVVSNSAGASQRIAIVGSGISGMAAGWYLSAQHEVTLFEADSRLGGHTATMDVDVKGQTYAIDTGFIVFNDWTYPHFQRLMATLGVASQATEMSFSVHETARDFEYNGHTLGSLFAQRRNLFNPSFYRLLRNILRFNKQATKALDRNELPEQMTLGEYLDRHHYNRDFQQRYLLPMGAAIWSASISDLRAFPLAFFVRFFRNHGLLSVNHRPQWYTLVGGSKSYIPYLTAPYASRIHLNTPVTKIIRERAGERAGVTITTPAGSQHFDQVVLACHADQALAMLGDASEDEKAVLGAMPYQDNEVVLHTDTSLLPRRKRAWASWNYRLDQRDSEARVSVTYDMNILQRIESDTTFCVTLNDSVSIDTDKVLGRYTYAHPQFTLAGQAAQARHAEISSTAHRTHFCGAYWRNGFHEDGVWSALRVAQALGCDEAAPPPAEPLALPAHELLTPQGVEGLG
tara:strand:+ start:152222 stop:153601 length:1380 start_codon:yes stop_codon:yes gene_type:complete